MDNDLLNRILSEGNTDRYTIISGLMLVQRGQEDRAEGGPSCYVGPFVDIVTRMNVDEIKYAPLAKFNEDFLPMKFEIPEDVSSTISLVYASRIFIHDKETNELHTVTKESTRYHPRVEEVQPEHKPVIQWLLDNNPETFTPVKGST